LNGDVLGLTAGHVLSGSGDGLVYAPAHKPFSEAEQIVEIGIRQASDDQKAIDAWSRMKERMDESERQLGSIVLADIDVVDTERIGVFNADEDRRTDNCLSKVEYYSQVHQFRPDGDKLGLPRTSYQIEDVVWEAGIRTGLTEGTIMRKAYVNWGTKEDRIDTECHAILGKAAGDGTWETFANLGDSGSAVVRLMRTGPAPGVSASELVGILHGIVAEGDCSTYVALFMPIQLVVSHIREKLGFEISLDVPDRPEQRWEHEGFGEGRSSMGLK
jgi:hypothetical protein